MAKKLGDFFQIYVAFSEYLNFTKQTGIILYFLCTWHSSGRSSTVSSCSKCEDRRMSRSINQSCTPISLYSLGIKLISKLEGLDKFPIIKIGQTFTFNMVNCHAFGAMDYVIRGCQRVQFCTTERPQLFEFDVASCRTCRLRSKTAILEVATSNLQKWWGFAQSWGPCMPIWHPLIYIQDFIGVH